MSIVNPKVFNNLLRAEFVKIAGLYVNRQNSKMMMSNTSSIMEKRSKIIKLEHYYYRLNIKSNQLHNIANKKELMKL